MDTNLAFISIFIIISILLLSGCTSDVITGPSGGGGGDNPFNQDLNTTDDVNFDEVTISQFLHGLFGGAIDLSGDPWYLTGTSFQVVEDITADTYHGSFTRKQGVWIAATAMRVSGTKPATLIEHGCSVAYEFSDNQEEQTYFNFRIPAGINLSYMPTLNIGWSSPATNKLCNWTMTYSLTALNDDTTIACEFVNYSLETSSLTADGLTMFQINISDITAGDKCIHVTLMRDGNDVSDTLSDDAHLHGICFSYYQDYDLV